MSAQRSRILYGHASGRWLLAEIPADQAETAPGRIGDLTMLGEPGAVLTSLCEMWKMRQKQSTERARAARRTHHAALTAWESADPATRGPAPEPPSGWQPAKRGRPRSGVQQQLAELIGVGQQAVSRYLNHQRAEMTLSDDGWSALVRACFDERTGP